MKAKITIISVLILFILATRFVLWDLNISTGKRVGNLVKISKKGKIWFMQTWEVTLDEGSGDKLTSYLSVKDEDIAQELYKYEGKQVVLFYEEHIIGFPRDSKYVITSWKAVDSEMTKFSNQANSNNSALIENVSKTLFCSLLGSIKKDNKLYNDVKNYIQKDNLYLYNQYKKCNE